MRWCDVPSKLPWLTEEEGNPIGREAVEQHDLRHGGGDAGAVRAVGVYYLSQDSLSERLRERWSVFRYIVVAYGVAGAGIIATAVSTALNP